MNIFVLDDIPSECARFHNDRHVSKMILDCAQILSTAHIEIDGRDMASSRVALIERPPHVNHPSARWARKTLGNYNWTAELMHSLIQQFKIRNGGRVHHYERIAAEYLNRQPIGIEQAPLTAFEYVGPVRHRMGSVVESYRRYYFEEKQDQAVWTTVGAPSWWRRLRGDRGIKEAAHG